MGWGVRCVWGNSVEGCTRREGGREGERGGGREVGREYALSVVFCVPVLSVCPVASDHNPFIQHDVFVGGLCVCRCCEGT